MNYKPYYSCGRLEKPLEHCQDKSFAEPNRRNLEIACAVGCMIPTAIEFCVLPRTPEQSRGVIVSVISHPAQQLVHGPMRLIDSRIGISSRCGISVGDGNSAKTPAADHIRTLIFRPVRIEQRVVFRCVAVRPAIHGDRGDVASGIETARAEGAGELSRGYCARKSRTWC